MFANIAPPPLDASNGATRPADALMAAHLAGLAAAERRSAEYVERNNHAQHLADAEAHRATATACTACTCTACRNGDHINCPTHACACQRAGHPRELAP
jgi:hypothetical protein